jgi:hypothetical protein
VGFIYIVWCEHTQITGQLLATPLVNNNNEVYKNIWKQYQDNTRFPTKTAILGTSHIRRKVLQAETLKPEWWGSPLAQEEKCQGRKKTCDKR